jgi:4-hydroxyphenylpyruvate dioxygenase
MNYWAGFYEKFFNFREIRQFDIQGQETGLISRAMTAPDNKIRIPLNEEARGGGEGQIEEFLMHYNGEGIQHIAFSCTDIAQTLIRLKDLGVAMMTPPPASYYEMLSERLPNHGQSIDELREHGILLDGTTESGEPRLLLQIFSEALIGPIFFEFIERKGDEGFGEGNFQALFEAMERDQLRRGALELEGVA